MEVLVGLPFGNHSTLLSYAGDFALFSVGIGTMPQQVLNVVTTTCRDLGLQIYSEKSWAMAVKTFVTDESLLIQEVGLTWCNKYLYLRILVDRRLTFRKEVRHQRKRTKGRLSMMQAMTRLRAGATHRVPRLY